MAPLGFSLLLLLSLAFSPSPSLSYEPRNPEVEALIGIRQALSDPRGVLNNWDEFSVDPCSWAMVTCSSENLVIGLGAPSQSLSGTLSGFIGNLTNLKQVLLQNNNIIGEIPPELGRLPKLQTLDLSNNRLSGSVPEAVGLINSLQYLRLNNNSLSGVIPVSLATVPQLAFLDLSYNDLSGRVPKISARTFNIVGNPLICGAGSLDSCSGSTPLLPFSSNTSPGKSRGRKLAIALGVSVSVASLLFIALGFLLWLRKSHQRLAITNTNDKQEEGLISLGNLRIFSLRELQLATNNFSSKNILGSGGFGNVYKGKLGDGMIVAVKRLNDMTGITGESQFRTELEMISLAVHRNLLRLIGYCATPNERLLVYPYMSNGSVASRLRGKPALDWDARKRIAIGAARGLMYLHEQCDPKIIHRDVKAANVLLDEYCEAVVGDFGLAKLLDHAESHVTTAVRGTFGHIAPEYLSTGQSSEKTDVFGFGILLLELISGMRALEFGKTVNQKGAMLEWVRKVQQEKVEIFVDRELRSQYDQIEAGEMLQVALLCTQYLPAHCPKISELLRKIHQENKVEVLVDRELGSNYDRIEAGEMLQVALLCTQYLPAHRPKMSEVVRMLEGDGLVEKWAAAHSHSNNNNLGMSFSHPNKNSDNNKSCVCPTGSTRHEEDNEHDKANMLCGANVEDDAHSLDVYAIELSGPR